jgi:hypothetical protein
MPMESATKTIQVTVVGQVAPTGTSKTITKSKWIRFIFMLK